MKKVLHAGGEHATQKNKSKNKFKKFLKRERERERQKRPLNFTDSYQKKVYIFDSKNNNGKYHGTSR
jgi:hypothetical protein